MAHFATIQRGRNNWALGYDVRGGIDARHHSPQIPSAITNQNGGDYGPGDGSGLNLTNCFLTSDRPLVGHANATVSRRNNVRPLLL